MLWEPLLLEHLGNARLFRLLPIWIPVLRKITFFHARCPSVYRIPASWCGSCISSELLHTQFAYPVADLNLLITLSFSTFPISRVLRAPSMNSFAILGWLLASLYTLVLTFSSQLQHGNYLQSPSFIRKKNWAQTGLPLQWIRANVV